VHRKAVDRWRAYEAHLAPMLPALAPYLERWGYAGPDSGAPGAGPGIAGFGSSNIR
jgi:hypothetical protein